MDKQPIKSSEEIDLLYFLKPIGNFISDYITTLKRNRLLILIVILFMTVGGYLLRHVITPGYLTRGVFISHVLPGKYFATTSDNLQDLIDEPQSTLLANELKISPELAGNIRQITITPQNDTFTVFKRDSAALAFTIELVIYNMNKVDSIQSALVNYFENSDYATRRKETKIKTLMALRSSLQQKVASLDSLKNIVNNSITPRSEGHGIIFGEPVDPVEVYKARTDNYKELLRIDEQLTLINNIEILQPFMKLEKYNYPKFNKLLIYAFLTSLFVAFIIVPLFRWRLK